MTVAGETPQGLREQGGGGAGIKTKRGKADEKRGQGQKKGSKKRTMIKKLS